MVAASAAVWQAGQGGYACAHTHARATSIRLRKDEKATMFTLMDTVTQIHIHAREREPAHVHEPSADAAAQSEKLDSRSLPSPRQLPKPVDRDVVRV